MRRHSGAPATLVASLCLTSSTNLIPPASPHTTAIPNPTAQPPKIPSPVFDVDDDQARAAALGMEVNGFSFEGMDAPGMDYALNR